MNDPAQAARVLSMLRKARTPLELDGASFIVKGPGQDPGSIDLEPLYPLGVVPEGDQTFRFLLHGAPFEVRGALQNRDGRYALAAPQVYSTNFRSMPRVTPKREATIDLEEGKEVGRLVDVSTTGVSFDTDDLALAEEGRDLRLSFQIGGNRFTGRGEVRSRRKGATGVRVGASFVPEGDPMELVSALIDERFPRLRRRAQVFPHVVRELFETSGYARLRSLRDVEPGWYRLDAPRQSIDRVFLGADGSPVGHISMTRAFSSTWIAHQLATLREHPESYECWRTIYRLSTMVPAMADGENARLLCYFDRNRRWHRRFLDSFCGWLGEDEDAVITNLDRFELDASTRAERFGLAGPRPALARTEDLAEVAELTRAHLPALTARSLDLTPEGLRAATLHAAYADSPLTRSREVLTLRREDELLGAVLLERGSPELSMFGLFDMAYVVAAPGPQSHVAARRLIDAAMDWYLARGISHPMIVAPAQTLPPDVHPALKFQESMGLMAWSSRGLRHYENFVEFTFGRTERAAQEQAA